MNAKVLASVALKVWGITRVVGALASLPGAVIMATASSATDAQAGLNWVIQMGFTLNLLVQALVGAAVIVWAGRITDAIVADPDAAIHVKANAHELQALGFALVGVFVLVQGLQNTAGAAYVLFSRPRFDATGALSYLWARQDQAIVQALVQIVAGVLLVFGRTTLARGWSRLRGQPANGDADAG